MGSTLELALASEANSKINLETWKKALSAHPQFSPLYRAAKGKFLDKSMRRLAEHADAKYLCWILERRFSEMFAKPEPPSAVVNVSQQVGIPADVIERARELAKESK